MRKEFVPNTIFSYNLAKKRLFLFIGAIIILTIIGLIVFYVTALRDSDLIVIQIINSSITHLINHVKNGTLLGSFYASLVGGLFFVFMPMEVAFINFLKSESNPVFLIILYNLGFVVSFTINYYIGMKLAGLSKKIITPKKFYKIKSIINKYGALAIFVFNVLPFPAQPLSAILGVFKYNKARFYFFFILGQTIKYTIISIAYIYIL